MKHNQQITAQIQASFKQMKSDSDFLDLMNEAKKHVYGDKAVPFSMRQLKYHASKTVTVKRSYVDIHELCKRLGITIDDTSSDSKRTSPLKAPKGGFNPIYHTFKVPKKGGGYRTICSPTAGLKAIQRTLAFILQCVFEPHKAATGFVRGKSVVDNAKMHEGNRYVYNIDLKDFFSSIDQARVWKCVQLKPFFLTGSTETVKVMNFDDFKQETNVKGVRPIDSSTYGRYLHFLSDDTEENYYTVRVGKNLNLPEGDLWDQIEPLVNDFSIYHGETANGPWISFGAKRPKGEFVSRGRLQIANIIASLCCTELEVERKNGKGEWEKVTRNVLPQGAPTSPVITNIVCQRLDYLLSGVARRFGLKYSRYADDITFSSMHNVYQPESDFLKELHRIIAEQNFHIKESKTRLQKDGYRKEVTGLLVNEKANVQKRYIKQLRLWLYYWERYGYNRAYSLFLQQYVADKGHVKKGKPDMVNIIAGKLDYLKMVKGAENELYLKLRSRFTNLSGVNAPIDALLEVWEREGIENAMNQYYHENDY